MSSPEPEAYEFGPYRIDPVERLLYRGDTHVLLAPKVTSTLLVLVQNAGRMVDKDALIKAVWPDTFVEEGALTRNISLLRRTLGDTGEEAVFIETIPRRGYRFIAPVQRSNPADAPAPPAAYNSKDRYANAAEFAERMAGALVQHGEKRAALRRTERDLIEEVLALLRQSDPRTLAPELAKHILKFRNANGLLKGQTSDQHPVRGEQSEPAILTVNTTPLMGSERATVRMRYPVFGSVSDFLDDLYPHVQWAVPPSTFGVLWALRDVANGKLYKDMGRSWAKNNSNRCSRFPTCKHYLDTRPLQEIGIEPGMVFEAVRLKEGRASCKHYLDTEGCS